MLFAVSTRLSAGLSFLSFGILSVMWYVIDKCLLALCILVFLVFPLFVIGRTAWRIIRDTFRPHEPTVWGRSGHAGYIETYSAKSGTGLIRDRAGADHAFSVSAFVCPSDTVPTEGRFVTFIPQPGSHGAVRSFRLDPARLSEVHISKKYAGRSNRALCLCCGRYMVPRPQYRYGVAVSSVCPFCLAEYRPPRYSK